MWPVISTGRNLYFLTDQTEVELMHVLIKRLDSPDEMRTFGKGKFEVIKVG